MDYFNKWSNVYAILNQETYIVLDILVTNFFHCFRFLRELHNDQGQNLKRLLLKGLSWYPGMCKTCTTPLHLWSGSVVELYVKTVEEHLWRSFWQTRGLGMRGHTSFCWPTKDQSMKPHAKSPPAWCAGGISSLWRGVRGSPTKRTHDQLYERPHETLSSRQSLCPSVSENGQWQDEGLLQPPIQLCWIEEGE
jgi:hypothetical protein